MAPAATKNSNPWFAVSMGLLGLIVGYGAASGTSILPSVPSAPAQVANDPTPPAPTVAADPADVDDDPMLGDDSAPVTLIEFTDYQCPFCERFFTQTYGQIKENYIDTGKVKLVVRDFPLSFHQNAQKSAEASECADDQGKFWEMHDKLFEQQSAWVNLSDPTDTFAQYARDIGGMNVNTFTKCLNDGTNTQEVRADLAAGSKAGIDGTPGFWVIGKDGKGERISGAQPYANFSAAIERHL